MSAKRWSLALLALLGACGAVSPEPAALDDRRVIVAIRVIREEPVVAEARATPASGSPADASMADAANGKVAETRSAALDEPGERGDLYARAGLLSEAIVEYQRAVDAHPDDAVRHFKLGLAFQSVRRFDEALASYQAAARLEPKSVWAHAAVAIVYAKMGNQDGAFASYRTVKELDGTLAQDVLEVIMQYGDFRDV
jgi:tetratricopeptide (TPR) repeat protein